ncbi:hypothetical protein NT6N_00980 [Oceaniferula spumae]|uniref:DUF2357 domain-containing protein n=1 Tax=Oceaniferula spumae TaxID=2979115 RepID=A0AAT9FGH0_9BACT
MINLDAITILLDEESQLALTIASSMLASPLDSSTSIEGLPDEILGSLDENSKVAPIHYDGDARRRGVQPISIKEAIRYTVAVHYINGQKGRDSSQCQLTSSVLENPRSGWVTRKMGNVLIGDFQVVNYIGIAWIKVENYPPIKFDITPTKMGYEIEYRSMVEDIAAKCQQLLLEWNSLTSLSFSPDPEQPKRLLLEQFLFVRHCLGEDRLDLYLEILNRNCHRTLIKEQQWGEIPDKRFYQNPLRYGRDWAKAPTNSKPNIKGFVPTEIQALRQRDSLDTAPNRFIKYALTDFLAISQAVIDHQRIEGAAHDEAIAMREALDAFLSQTWLQEVGDLDQVPLNNQTLQKRDGYRQILEAWLLSDVAAQLDWEGREDTYDGNNRDVATLYEYWIYFEIYNILAEEIGCECIDAPTKSHSGEALPFMTQNDAHGLKINLKAGKSSYSSFVYRTTEGITNRIYFYYNRSFENNKLLAPGTYSRRLRPDYTLVIIPESIAQENKSPAKAERQAQQVGQISYLHFDAKYRVESITEIFGDDSNEEESAIERQEEKVTKTYRRGDLYKMHTYNEAIRRTVGSYVLYPGTVQSKDDTFVKYHEIIPGVGAFALRPGAKTTHGSRDGRDALIQFLNDTICHHASRMTQLSRLNDSTHRIVREAPTGKSGTPKVANPNTPVILGYMATALSEKIANQGYFYCRALNNHGTPTNIDLALSSGTLLTGYTGGFHHRKSVNWCAEISSVKIVSPKQLKSETGETPSKTDVPYILIKFHTPWALEPRNLQGIAPNAGGLTTHTTWGKLVSAPVIL